MSFISPSEREGQGKKLQQQLDNVPTLVGLPIFGRMNGRGRAALPSVPGSDRRHLAIMYFKACLIGLIQKTIGQAKMEKIKKEENMTYIYLTVSRRKRLQSARLCLYLSISASGPPWCSSVASSVPKLAFRQ